MSDMPTYRGRIISALVLIGLGLLFLLGNIGFFNTGDVFGTYWPVILIAIGASRFLDGRRRDSGGGLFFIGLGVLFLAFNLNILGGDIADYWPLVLVLLGVWILFKPRYHHRNHKEDWEKWGHDSKEWSRWLHHSIEEDAKGRLNVVTIFGGQDRPIQSEDFRGGDVTIIFGGSKLDLRQVKTALKDIHIEITAVFSGLDIIIPPEWTLDVNITPLFGSVEDKRRNVFQDPSGDNPRLHLHGSCVFSGIEFTS